MVDVRILYYQDRYNTSEANPDDEWSRSSTAASYTDIIGIECDTDGTRYSDFFVDFPIEEDKTYYLVYADYCTGDSFGSDNNQLEFVDLYTTREKAQACLESISKEDTESFSAYYVRENGQSVQTYKPWAGYFEYLNSINIEEVRLIS